MENLVSKLEAKNSVTQIFARAWRKLIKEVREEPLSISVSLSVSWSPLSVNGEFPFIVEF